MGESRKEDSKEMGKPKTEDSEEMGEFRKEDREEMGESRKENMEVRTEECVNFCINCPSLFFSIFFSIQEKTIHVFKKKKIRNQYTVFFG